MMSCEVGSVLSGQQDSGACLLQMLRVSSAVASVRALATVEVMCLVMQR